MKICLTTFVQGHLYQEYLPMLIYSIGKAYPEYDVKIFLHDTLRDDLRPALDMTDRPMIVSRFGNIPSQIVRT